MSKVDRITYNKTFVIGPYMNEKIGVEMQVDSDSEDIYEAFEYAKRIVEGFHKASSPHIGEPITYGSLTDGETVKWETAKPTPPPVIDRKAIERLEKLIDDSESIIELEGYKQDAAKLGVVDLWNDKYNSFKKGSMG